MKEKGASVSIRQSLYQYKEVLQGLIADSGGILLEIRCHRFTGFSKAHAKRRVCETEHARVRGAIGSVKIVSEQLAGYPKVT